MNPRPWLVWTAGFLSFPLAGIAGGAVAGPVDSTAAGLVGGLVTGLVIGTGQSLVGRGRVDPRRWVPATAVGMSLGLAAGAAAVGFGTSLGELAAMGAITGAVLGCSQAWALSGPGPAGRGSRAGRLPRGAWPLGLTALWCLGWTVTTLAGVDVERQYMVFGATGAITVSALSGLLLELVRPLARPAVRPTPIADPS